MRRDPQKVAWAILLASFFVFCTLAVSIPLTIRWWIITAATSHDATLEVINGTVLVRLRGMPPDVGVTSQREIPEGSVIRTDANSKALLTFFDDSRVTIFPNSEVRLIKARSPSFGLSPRPNEIALEQNAGRIRVGPALPTSRPTDWRVSTPHSQISLSEGSYSVMVSNQASEIAVRRGKAIVEAKGQRTSLPPGKRVVVPLGEGPSDLLPAARNLIINGDFSRGLSGWRTYSASGREGVEGGEAELTTFEGREVLRFYRQGEDRVHTEAGITQKIDQDVSDYLSLQLRLDVRINSHSLGGGGYLSSEYPVIVRIDYEDEYGSAAHWYHGFYCQNIHNNPTLNGERIRCGVWYPYEETNLLEILEPPPFYIRSVQIYASGWNYESLVAEIGLLVE
ncbi:MAG: FecR domain-containing protein [Anaerolineae bacterium]